MTVRELLLLSSSGNRFHDLAQFILGAKSDRTLELKYICRFDNKFYPPNNTDKLTDLHEKL